MYDAILGSIDRRVQGGHLLIPFLANLQGRGSSECWFKFEFNVLQNSGVFAN